MKTLFLVANSVSTQGTVDQKQFQPSDIPVAGKLDQVEAVPGSGGGQGGGVSSPAGLHTQDGRIVYSTWQLIRLSIYSSGVPSCCNI